MERVEALEKIIERHKWTVAKYVLDNGTMDVGQSSKDLAKRIDSALGLDEGKIQHEIDFWLQHLVAKVTDGRDYISKDKRIEGHKVSISSALVNAKDIITVTNELREVGG